MKKAMELYKVASRGGNLKTTFNMSVLHQENGTHEEGHTALRSSKPRRGLEGPLQLGRAAPGERKHEEGHGALGSYKPQKGFEGRLQLGRAAQFCGQTDNQQLCRS